MGKGRRASVRLEWKRNLFQVLLVLVFCGSRRLSRHQSFSWLINRREAGSLKWSTKHLIWTKPLFNWCFPCPYRGIYRGWWTMEIRKGLIVDRWWFINCIFRLIVRNSVFGANRRRQSTRCIGWEMFYGWCTRVVSVLFGWGGGKFQWAGWQFIVRCGFFPIRCFTVL